MATAGSTLLMIPTPQEREALLRLEPRLADRYILETVGFGPVSAAIGAMAALAHHRPPQVFLVGLAGTFIGDALGSVVCYHSVCMTGIGLPTSQGLASGVASGFDAYLRDQYGPLLCPPGLTTRKQLLTVCIPAANTQDIDVRRTNFPDAAGEDMEGYAVAAACHRHQIPLAIIRAVSNEVGQRDKQQWRFREAFTALAKTLCVLSEPPLAETTLE